MLMMMVAAAALLHSDEVISAADALFIFEASGLTTSEVTPTSVHWRSQDAWPGGNMPTNANWSEGRLTPRPVSLRNTVTASGVAD